MQNKNNYQRNTDYVHRTFNCDRYWYSRTTIRKYYPIRHRCQFSWYCDGKSDEIPSFDGDIFQLIYEYAELYLRPDVILIDITDGATPYHADYVFPEWRKSKTKTVEIGDHIFYRWEK